MIAEGEAAEWMYGSIMCRITGYIEVTLFSISVSKLHSLRSKIIYSSLDVHIHVDLRRPIFG